MKPQSDKFLNQLSSKKCSVNYCLSDWKSKKKKEVTQGNLSCIDDCSMILLYEYNNKCYSNCPNGTSPKENNPFVCFNISNNNMNNSLNLTDEILNDERTTQEIINDENITEEINKEESYMSNQKIKLYQEDVNYIKSIMQNHEIDSIISNITNNNAEDYIIKNNDIIIQITSTFNQKKNSNNNISTIIIDKKCESILKTKYNITEEEHLLIIKYDLYIEGLNIPLIGYEAFNPKTKAQLDLKYCENIDVDINIPVSINEVDLYKYNPEGDYYNDICKTYDNGKNYDITIGDRKKEYNDYNLSICPNNCTFNDYNYETKKVSCQCEAQTKPASLLLEDIFDKDKLLNNFIDFKSISNINIIKCFNEALSKHGLKTNIGNYVILGLLSFFILLCILFYLLEYKLFLDDIDKIVVNYENEINKNTEIVDNIKENKIEENQNEVNKKYVNNPIKKKKINESKNNDFEASKKIELSGDGKESSKSKISLEITNNINNNNYNNIYINSEINFFSYQNALKLDNRSFWQYYISLIKSKHIIIFTFFPTKDYNSTYIKICLFIFNFISFYFVNTLFFTDSTLHRIYEDEGIFNFIYLLPQIIYSFIISSIINIIVRFLALTDKNIIKLKNENKEKKKQKLEEVKKFLKIKFMAFFIICMILIVFFWYYITCFGYVYKNTQIHLLKDTLISFGLSLLYPFIICLLPAIFRMISLHKPEYIYKFSVFLQLL